MVDYLPRTAWTAVPAAGSAMPAKPAGIVVHWPGEKRPIGTSLSVVRAKLEGYRRFHKTTHGWADIAYQVAFDQAGRVWDLRGIGRMSAANGNRDLNERYLAALFMVGEGEHPTTELLDAWRHWRSTVALRKHPTATQVKGHRQVRPGGTTCPGHIVQALITSGALLTPATAPTPTQTTEDDMNADQNEALKRVDRRVLMNNQALGRLEATTLPALRAQVQGLVGAVAAMAKGEPFDEAKLLAGVEAAANKGAQDALDARIADADVNLTVTSEG